MFKRIYPVALARLTMVALLTCSAASLMAQDKPTAGKDVESGFPLDTTIKIFDLENITADSAVQALLVLQSDDVDIQAQAVSATNEVVVNTSPEMQQVVEALLLRLDEPRPPEPGKVVRILADRANISSDMEVLQHLGYVEAGVKASIDPRRKALILFGEQSEIESAISFIKTLDDLGNSQGDVSQSGSLMRFVWLATAEDGSVDLDDQKNRPLQLAVLPLERLGMGPFDIVAQAIVHVGPEVQPLNIKTTGKGDRQLRVNGSVDGLTAELEINCVEDIVPPTEFSATVKLAPEQWAVLGAVGAGDRHNVIAVQRMEQ